MLAVKCNYSWVVFFGFVQYQFSKCVVIDRFLARIKCEIRLIGHNTECTAFLENMERTVDVNASIAYVIKEIHCIFSNGWEPLII